MYHRRIRDSFLVRMIVDIGDMKIIDFRGFQIPIKGFYEEESNS